MNLLVLFVGLTSAFSGKKAKNFSTFWKKLKTFFLDYEIVWYFNLKWHLKMLIFSFSNGAWNGRSRWFARLLQWLPKSHPPKSAAPSESWDPPLRQTANGFLLPVSIILWNCINPALQFIIDQHFTPHFLTSWRCSLAATRGSKTSYNSSSNRPTKFSLFREWLADKADFQDCNSQVPPEVLSFTLFIKLLR